MPLAIQPDDTQQQMMAAYGMATPAPIQGAPVDPHASLTAPISAAPPEPPAMMAAAGSSEGKPAKMSALDGQKEHINGNLMADYQKDADPYGSDENHPGFFGKLLHGLNVATGGVNRRGMQEQGLEGRIQNIAKQESEEGLQGAETSGREEQTQEAPQKAVDAHLQSGATTRDANDRAQGMEDTPAPEPTMAQAYAHRLNEVLKANGDPSQDAILSHIGDAITSLQKQPTAPKMDYQTIVGPDGKPHVYGLDATGKKVADEGVHYEKPDAAASNAGTWSLQNGTDGNPILFNSKTGNTENAPGGLARKPNAEEQKRADLATNVNENLDKLEDIANRRPDLFGPVAGRMTKMRETVGTSDPDVATLKTLEDNLGMAMQSAHGMRSAQHVETSAQSVLNGFKNSPQALKAAIKAARASVGTFQNNVQDTNNAGKPSEGSGPKAGDTEGGYRFKGGDPAKQSNWEKAQ